MNAATAKWAVLVLLAGPVTLGCDSGDDSSLGNGGNGGTGGTGGEPSTSGGMAGFGGGMGGAGGQAEPDGTWANPYVISELPFFDARDTTEALSSEAALYAPCAPDTVEAGPEIVYRVDLAEPGWLTAQIDDVIDDAIDLDLHLLAGADPSLCVTRDDFSLGSPVSPGSYWIVVDTWSDDGYAGEYELEVDLITDDGGSCFESPIECDDSLPPFVNLTLLEEPGDPGCLPGMVRVEDFCVDRFEAIVVEMTGRGWMPVSPYAHPANAATLAALSIEQTIPQGHISQVQAVEACATAGKRLCENDEWLRACQGASGFTYPYGDSLEPGACNDARDCHPVIQTFESTDSWIWSELNHPCISQLPDGLSTAGSHAECITEEGALDMMGNLHEWTADPAGTFRGGFYVDTQINGPGCLYATTAHDVSHFDYSTGFRCCADLSN